MGADSINFVFSCFSDGLFVLLQGNYYFKKTMRRFLYLLISGIALNASASQVFVAPSGSDMGNGTITSPLKSIGEAVKRIAPGDTIYLRGGVYACDKAVKIASKSGNEQKMTLLSAYPGDKRPVLDFAGVAALGKPGITLSADYWHLYGFDVTHAGKNGFRIVLGSHNLFEFLSAVDNGNAGFQLAQGAAYNIFKNCDAYYNADAKNEDADGFAPKLDVGSENRFIGCRAWMNSDDGYDGYLRGDDREINTYYENCIAYKNGFLKDGSRSKGDGNGFKLGGCDKTALRRHNSTVTHCIAADNWLKGFDRNSTMGSMTLQDCFAFRNGVSSNTYNYGFSQGKSTQLATGKMLTIKDCISLKGKDLLLKTSPSNITGNSWQRNEFNVSDYDSFDPAMLIAPRQHDGSLPQEVLKWMKQ